MAKLSLLIIFFYLNCHKNGLKISCRAHLTDQADTFLTRPLQSGGVQVA